MTHLVSGVAMAGPSTLFIPVAKIDAEQRLVYGYASTQARDSQGEIVLRSALEAALPDYMRFGNVREMHQPSAVGKAVEASMDEKGLWFGAKVVDDGAWAKVKAGVYAGFSIGGRVTSRDSVDKSIIVGLELTEISLVDRPANPEATYSIVKRVGGRLQVQLGHAERQAKEAAQKALRHANRAQRALLRGDRDEMHIHANLCSAYNALATAHRRQSVPTPTPAEEFFHRFSRR